MIIDEITLHNFGIYRGRQKVALAPTSPHKPIILIGGHNGGGKTTLLDAIHLVLFGKNALCSNRGNLSYEEYLRRCINHSIEPKDGAALELQFRQFMKGNEHIIRVHRSWSQNGKDIRETLDILKDGKLDRVMTSTWNEYVEKYFPSRISNLFFFDGEKIENFADLENSTQLLSTAFHALLGLDIVDQLSADLNVLERRKRANMKISSEQQKKIEDAEAELSQLEEKRADLKLQRASLQNDLEHKQKRLGDIESTFRREGGELFEQRGEIESKKLDNENTIMNIEKELIAIADGSIPLLLVSNLIENIERQDFLEESSYQSKILYDTLEERDFKLLEDVGSWGLSNKYNKRLQKYLTDDRSRRQQNVECNSYLHLDNETKQQIRQLGHGTLKGDKERTKVLLNRLDELKSDLDEQDRKLANIPDQERINHILEKREKARSAIKEIQYKIKALDEEFTRISWHIEQRNSVLVKLIEKVVEKDYYYDGVSRILHHSSKVRETLGTFRTQIIKSNVKKIEQLILDSFNRLIRKKTLIRELSIDPESFVLKLWGGDGKSLTPDRLSAGERQLLAISILWGLARASGRPLPTAIDTPLGRLDSLHRTFVVKWYFPYASHQVLIFSTDEEIDSKYYKILKPHISRSYVLEYDDNTCSTNVRSGYFFYKES
jgi:DNA sulfur modification protein DndD